MNEMNDTESAWTGLSQEDEIRLHLSIDRLHDNLAKDYNKEVRPNFHIGQPVTVNISMTVSHFDLVMQQWWRHLAINVSTRIFAPISEPIGWIGVDVTHSVLAVQGIGYNEQNQVTLLMLIRGWMIH